MATETRYEVGICPKEFSMRGDSYDFDWIMYHAIIEADNERDAQKIALAYASHGIEAVIRKIETTTNIVITEEE